jgi:hypothetical protein
MRGSLFNRFRNREHDIEPSAAFTMEANQMYGKNQKRA